MSYLGDNADVGGAIELSRQSRRVSRAGDDLRRAMRVWVKARLGQRFDNPLTLKSYATDVVYVLDAMLARPAAAGSAVRLGGAGMIDYLMGLGEVVGVRRDKMRRPATRRRIMAVKRLLEIEGVADRVDWQSVTDARRAVELVARVTETHVGPEMIVLAIDAMMKRPSVRVTRDRCLLLLMYLAYLRPREVLALRPSDVSLRGRILVVRQRDRTCYLGPRGAVPSPYCPVSAYEDWMRVGGRLGADKLFCSVRRTGFGMTELSFNEDLSEWGLRELISERLGSISAAVYGVKRHVRPKDLRAGFLAVANRQAVGPFAGQDRAVTIDDIGELVVVQLSGERGA